MNPKIEPEIEKQVKVALVKPLSISCHKCGSDNYKEIDLTKAGTQRYCCENCKAKFVQFPNNIGLIKGDDVWLPEDLGLHIQPHRKGRGTKLNFQHIKQVWLKEVAKRFIKYRASTQLSFGRLRRCIDCFNDFSLFLLSIPYVKRAEDIDRSIIIKYLEYTNQRKLAPSTRSNNISALASLFEAGTANNWFVVEPYLIRREDYPRAVKTLPRYIPAEVVHQLNQHLDKLPESIMRMVLVIQECGLRIGELCQLPLDCLKQDSQGAWFIQFIRWKMNFETTLPVSIELAQVIKEQQSYIQQHLSKDYQYLFCANKRGGNDGFIPIDRVITDQSFIYYIKQLADKFDICDNIGKRWSFQTHQFRHTVGTRMINNNVPQHIIQRYLGHSTPHMLRSYEVCYDLNSVG